MASIAIARAPTGRAIPGTLGELAFRLTGSSDLFDDGRRPYHSINFITAHDGFTLYDSVAYNEKHNEANGENNQDGHNDNRSWNCGDEGPTDDPRSTRCAAASSAISWPRSSFPKACPCYSAAMSLAARKTAITMPTARITRSPGSTGSSRSGSRSCASLPRG